MSKNVNYQWRKREFFRGITRILIEGLVKDDFEYDEAVEFLKDCLELEKIENKLNEDMGGKDVSKNIQF